MCSFISFPYIRDGGMTSFLATTLPAALHDTTRRIALTPGRLEPLGTRDPTQAVWGQLVRLQAVRGGMADTLAARLGAGDSAAAVVRWAFDSMCSPVPIHAMLEPGELDYFIGALRPPAAWIEGHPTLDVSPMSQCLMWCIYPHLNPAYVRQDASPSYRGSDSTNMLDVVDFASFYETLPTAGEWNKDGCRRAVERVKAWSENHNALSYRYPVASTIRDLADMCGRLSKRVNND